MKGKEKKGRPSVAVLMWIRGKARDGWLLGLFVIGVIEDAIGKPDKGFLLGGC